MPSKPYLANKWIPSPHNLILSNSDIHLWRIVLPQSEEIKRNLFESLSNDELSRLAKFYFNRDKDRFLISRGGLRNILARYLNIYPNQVDFQYKTLGKPYINNKNLYFNVSHAANCIVYAVSNCSPIGIDIEYCEHDIDYLSITKNFFSNNEYTKLLTLHSDKRLLAFYRCWTRKEAYIKAIGKGLHFPLHQLEVSLLPDEEIQLLKIMDKTAEKDLWKLVEIFPQQDYIASIATQQSFNNCLLWDWKIA